MEVRHAYASRESRNLRVVPFNRKRNRSAAQHAEVVSVMRVFPDVFSGEHHILPERLLQTGMKLVAPSGSKWSRHARCCAPQQRDRTSESHPVLASTRFSLNGVSSTRA